MIQRRSGSIWRVHRHRREHRAVRGGRPIRRLRLPEEGARPPTRPRRNPGEFNLTCAL